MADNRKTPVFDFQAGEFVLNFGRVVAATGGSAVKEIIQKAQLTPRGKYLVYANELPSLNHKYGSDVQDIATRRDLSEELRLSELKRAVKDAIAYDPWVMEVYSVDVYRTGRDELVMDYAVRTIYDTDLEVKGVALSG